MEKERKREERARLLEEKKQQKQREAEQRKVCNSFALILMLVWHFSQGKIQ